MSDDNQLLGRVMKGAGFILMGMLLSKVFNYIFRLIVARYLGPAPYGLFTLGLALVGVIVAISLLGVPQGIVKFVAHYKGKQDYNKLSAVLLSSLKLTVPLGIISAVLVFIFAPQLSSVLFSKPELTPILQVLAVSIPILVLIGNVEKTILAFQKVEYSMFARNFVEPLIKVGFAIILVYFGLGIVWIASAYVFAIFSSMILMYWFLNKKIYSLKSVFTSKAPMSGQLLTYSLPLLFSEVSAYLLVWTDTLILGFYMTSTDVGIYNAAIPTALLVYIVPTTIRTMFFPVMSEYYANHDNYVKFFKRVSDWVLFLTLPVAVFLIFFASEFMGLFFGGVYVQGAMALIVVCAAYFIYALGNTSHSMIYVLKRTNLVLFNTIVAVVLNVVLNIILIPQYGILGAAIATGVSLLARTILILIEGFFLVKGHPFSWRSLIPFFVVLVPLAVSFLVKPFIVNVPFLIIWSIVFAILYLLLLLIVGFFTKKDIEIVVLLERKLPFSMKWLERFLLFFV